MPIQIRTLDPESNGARELIGELDAYLSGLYPPDDNHLDPPDELKKAHVHFRGAWLDGELVGCGAVKIMDEGRYGEIKRLYVRSAARGRGVGRALMRELEGVLQKRGVIRALLETGSRQPEALALYEMLGYARRGPFGVYREGRTSIFMEKNVEP